MEYKLLKIYTLIGQYDEVCGVTFRKDSEAFLKYGSSITGDFFYTKEERLALQERLKNRDTNDYHGYVKFIERLTKDTDVTKELMKNGFNSADIISIISIPKPQGNKFVQQENRSLPEPIVIKFDPKGFDAVKAMIHLHRQKERDGYKLTEFEIEETIGYEIIDNKYNIPAGLAEEFFNPDKPGEIKPSIRYFVLKHKFINETLTGEEQVEFENLSTEIAKQRMQILLKELERSTEKLKKVGIDYKDAVNGLTYLISGFEPEILLLLKFPIWWNLERFLHIFVRHVSEVKVGERNEDRTAFQYRLRDIVDLIKIVLKSISKEIEEHFKKNPEKDFKRQGFMSVYYNGDYYVVHIASNGLLLAFYKNS